MKWFGKAALAAVLLASVSAGAASAATAIPDFDVAARADALKPGEYFWQPHLAPSGDVELVVSIPLQRAFV